MQWDEYKSAFTWDGSWRDLYVLQSDRNDWQALLDFLRKRGYRLTFGRDQQERVPEQVDEMFKNSGLPRPLLQIDIGGPVLNCHFFTEEEIELDLDPREITGNREAEAVLGFMKEIAELLHKPIRLTPENMREAILLEYNPATHELNKGFEYNELQ